MAREESAAERSLRELQEQAGVRSSGSPASGSHVPGIEAPRRRPWVPVLLGLGAVAVVAAGAVASGVGPLGGGGESGVEVGSYEDADFATSYDEATAAQAEKGRVATSALESLELPDEWTPREGSVELTMREDDDDNASAILSSDFTVPADYSAEDVRAWFEAEPTVASSDPEDASCDDIDADGSLRCRVVITDLARPGDRDGSRPMVSFTYFAASSAADEGSVLVRSYSFSFG